MLLYYFKLDDLVTPDNSKETVNIFISEFRAIATTTPPVWNSSKMLVMIVPQSVW
jgi:hypothetical protein